MTAADDITDLLQRWTAAEQSADAEVIGSFLTGDFVGVGPLGFLLPRDAWLERHRSGELTYTSFAMEEPQIRVYGESAAVVIAHHIGKGAYKGNPIPEETRATLTLAREESGWLISGIHLSFMAGTPGAPPIPGRPQQ